jgi:hypothetical protein
MTYLVIFPMSSRVLSYPTEYLPVVLLFLFLVLFLSFVYFYLYWFSTVPYFPFTLLFLPPLFYIYLRESLHSVSKGAGSVTHQSWSNLRKAFAKARNSTFDMGSGYEPTLTITRRTSWCSDAWIFLRWFRIENLRHPINTPGTVSPT